MQDKELLSQAIENYDALSPAHRKVLQILVDIAVDGTVPITVIKLSTISKFSRPLIYQALDVLERHEFIEVIKTDKSGIRSKLNSITLNNIKLENVIKHYDLEKRASAKYSK